MNIVSDMKGHDHQEGIEAEKDIGIGLEAEKDIKETDSDIKY
jgi:hypothetical protein